MLDVFPEYLSHSLPTCRSDRARGVGVVPCRSPVTRFREPPLSTGVARAACHRWLRDPGARSLRSGCCCWSWRSTTGWKRSAGTCPAPRPPAQYSCRVTPTRCASWLRDSWPSTPASSRSPTTSTASARTLGATPWRTMAVVHVPLAKASSRGRRHPRRGRRTEGAADRVCSCARSASTPCRSGCTTWPPNRAIQQAAFLPSLTIIAVAAVPVVFLSRLLEKAQ